MEALLPSTIGETIRLGEDPDALPNDRRAQAEPHLARSFNDPNLLLATFQEGRYEDGGAYANGVAISRDGGVTWTRELLPGLVKNVERGRFDRASDPVVAIDSQGNLYVNSLGVRLTDTGEAISIVTLNQMKAGSDRWGRSSIIAEGTTYETWKRLRFSGKELMDPKLSGPEADVDSDGISNLEEYVYGLEPTRQDAAPQMLIQRSQKFENQVEISFPRLAVLGDVNFLIESCSNFQDWHLVQPEETSTDTAIDPTMETVRIQLPIITGSNQFIRMRPLLK